jgi:hypothetical protein
MDWDWKEQISLDNYNSYCKEIVKDGYDFYSYYVDTGGDSYCIIITEVGSLSQEQVMKLWEMYDYERDMP